MIDSGQYEAQPYGVEIDPDHPWPERKVPTFRERAIVVLQCSAVMFGFAIVIGFPMWIGYLLTR